MADCDEPANFYGFERESARVLDQTAAWMSKVKTGNPEADSCVAIAVTEAVMEIWRSTYADEKRARGKTK